MEITITRALSELKLQQKKYDKKVEELQVIAIKQGTKLRRPFMGQTPEDFSDKSKAAYQSLMSTMDRIIMIKTKIDESNAKTKIKIGQVEMTVQQALVEKKFITLKKSLLRKLQDLKATNNRDLENAELELTRSAEDFRKVFAGNGNNKSEADIETAVENYKKSEEISIVDAIGIDNEIAKLDAYIDDFESNVDFVLSESNSKTCIVIDD
jgi:hypothetical protein